MTAASDDIEELFAPIAATVSDFADKHGMRLEKCARGNSGWELISDHPAGGQVFLLMLYDQSLGLGMGSVWHYPCPEMSLYYSHYRKMRPCAIDAEPLCEMLDDELAGITAVKFGYWTHINPLPHSTSV